MKILMIAPQPFFQPRGTPISTYQRLQGLSSLGFEVDLITYHVGEDVTIPGVSIHRIPRIPFIKNVKVGPSWPKLFLDVILFIKAIIMLIKNRYDVIHSHEEAAFIGVILAPLFGKPHLYDMHSILSRQLENFNFGNYSGIIKIFEMLEKWVINTCDALITIGIDIEAYAREINPTVREIMIENLAINVNDTVTTTQRLVDERKQELGLNNKLPIVYAGTFERYQGLDLLIESIKIVKNYHPEILLILVGGKPDQVEYWQNEVKKNQLEDCTIFVGMVSPAEAQVYLQMAEILVSPRTEGLSIPLKIYSYLYSGKPMVATEIVGHTQVLNDEIAILVAPEREAFAEGILSLIQDPDLRQRLGLQAQKVAQKKYNFSNYLTKLEQIYQTFQPLPSVSEQQSSSPKEVIGS